MFKDMKTSDYKNQTKKDMDYIQRMAFWKIIHIERKND